MYDAQFDRGAIVFFDEHLDSITHPVFAEKLHLLSAEVLLHELPHANPSEFVLYTEVGVVDGENGFVHFRG